MPLRNNNPVIIFIFFFFFFSPVLKKKRRKNQFVLCQTVVAMLDIISCYLDAGKKVEKQSLFRSLTTAAQVYSGEKKNHQY